MRLPIHESHRFLLTPLPQSLLQGLDEEGLYRKPGIVSRASKLLKDGLEKGRLDKIDFTDEYEWDTKTIASAVKGYFSKHLGEPLLTFALHSQFVEAASKYSDASEVLFIGRS